MKTTFFGKRALQILMVVVFLTPFALRGARLAVERTKNDVKDWLPSGFPETRELDWFRNHFLGEQFVLVSWDGCTADDPRLELFTRKLFPHRESTVGQPGEVDPGLAVGEKYTLFTTGKYYQNWGGRDEKWLKGEGDKWFFILPSGELYRWTAGQHMFTGLKRLVSSGPVEGEQVASLDPSYYQYPLRLTAPLFKTVVTGPEILESLTKKGGVLENSPSKAAARLQGILFGPEKQTCFIATLTEAAKKNLHTSVGRGYLGKPRGRIFEIADECGIKYEQLHIGGPPVDNVAIDEEGTITLVRLVGLCIVLGLGLAYLCLRSIPATLIVFFIGGISAVMSLSFVWWLGGSVDAIMMSMPALIYVLAISGAVHVVNYYREAVESHGPVGAPEAAVAHGWKPAVLCSITTALGLLSLYTSDILPIRNFGLFSAIGVMATLLLLFTFLPAALQLWPLRPRTNTQKQPDSSWLERALAKFWEGLARVIIRHHALVSIGCTLLVFGVGWGCFKMNTSVQLIKMFDGEAKVIEDYQWLEANIGKLVPMELVVRVAPAALGKIEDDSTDPNERSEGQERLTFLERMEIADRIQKVIEAEFGEHGQNVVGQTMSAATFAPPLPQAGGGFFAFAERSTTNRRLEAHRDEFLHSDYLRTDKETGAELWRISVRLGAFNDVDYGQFVGVLKSTVEPILAAYSQRNDVLKALLDGTSGKQLSGESVLIVGAPFGISPETRQTLSDEQIDAITAEMQATQAALVPGTPAAQMARQTRTFAGTLYELLKVARLRIDWHDPQAEAVPADFGRRLASYGCVVLVGDSNAYDLAEIKKHAKQVIDARGLHFDPAAPVAADTTKTQAVSAIYTGVVPVVYKAQRTLLESLIQSTFWSFLTITPVMMFVTRSVLGGAVAMLPNIAPVFLIFGGMGWLGIDVDIGSMMTASIALGVAVDDTIHYLTWFRWELNKGIPRKEAIALAYKRCATPTFQTAVISGVGLSIFAASTFTPTQRFGYLMLTILLMGMFAELIFFPALLAGPLGKVFKRSSKPMRHPEGEAVTEADGLAHAPDSGAELVVAEEQPDGLLIPADMVKGEGAARPGRHHHARQAGIRHDSAHNRSE